MAYICYVYLTGEAVPYMEFLSATDLGEARARAAELMLERPAAHWAAIHLDDQLVATLVREGAWS